MSCDCKMNESIPPSLLHLVGRKGVTVFADGNLAWAHGCRKRGLECEQVTHQVKQFTRPVMRKPSSVLSSVAGTQSIDRAWRTLKAWLPQKLKTYEKRNGHHKMSQGVHSMIQQWMWRQTILPCSPKELMSCLVDLLKKYHDFQ